MNVKFNQSLLLLCASSALVNAYPDMVKDGAESSYVPCPFSRKLSDADFAIAKAEAAERIKEWKEITAGMDLPEQNFKIGEANEGEVFCNGNNDNKYCNKVHGAWGDSIPQDGEYCIWATLEFQDFNSMELGVEGGENNLAFMSTFLGVYEAVYEYMTPKNGIKLTGFTGGVVLDVPYASPWPISTVVFNFGNKYAKDWIATSHRVNAQSKAYSLGWITLHGHWKAVKCDEIDEALKSSGLTEDDFDGKGDGSGINGGLNGALDGTPKFVNLLNAFNAMEDHSSTFYSGDTCTVGPCADSQDTKDPPATKDPDNGGNYMSFLGMSTFLAISVMFYLIL